MQQFEVGKSYFMRSPCDHECIWTYTIAKRTAKTVTFSDGKRCRVKPDYSGAYEICSPLGTYSMSPILGADKETSQ